MQRLLIPFIIIIVAGAFVSSACIRKQDNPDSNVSDSSDTSVTDSGDHAITDSPDAKKNNPILTGADQPDLYVP
jgi:hypothetical protein